MSNVAETCRRHQFCLHLDILPPISWFKFQICPKTFEIHARQTHTLLPPGELTDPSALGGEMARPAAETLLIIVQRRSTVTCGTVCVCVCVYICIEGTDIRQLCPIALRYKWQVVGWGEGGEMERSDSRVQGGERRKDERWCNGWGKVSSVQEKNGYGYCWRVKGKRKESRRTDTGC